MSTIKTTIALLAGMAAGAALGLLFAPQTGMETRDKLSGSLIDLGDTIKETATTHLDEFAGTLKTKVMDLIRSTISGPAEEAADDLEHA